MKWPNQVLSVRPNFFAVNYAINPHMLDEHGNLNKVDQKLALSQWENLKENYLKFSLNVSEVEAVEGLPDMVFTANQTFPFLKNGKTQFILSRMNSRERQPEVEHFKNWAQKQNIECYELKSEGTFEGMGDALWNYESEEVYGGYGFRTSLEIYEEVEQIIEKPIYKLKLISEDFYHLDTCLAIANKNTAFAVKEGFAPESFELLKSKFKNLIVIPFEEAKQGFAANLCCINGKDIFIQKGNSETCRQARECGLEVHEFETSEFMKSGGSVFCMKQLYW